MYIYQLANLWRNGVDGEIKNKINGVDGKGQFVTCPLKAAIADDARELNRVICLSIKRCTFWADEQRRPLSERFIRMIDW